MSKFAQGVFKDSVLTLACDGLCEGTYVDEYVEACVELCDRRFSSVSRACWKQMSQLGVCPRFWYIFAEVFID